MSMKYKKEKEIEFLLESAIADSVFMQAFGQTPICSVATVEQKLLDVLDLDPENVEGLNLLAQVYAQTERPEKALQCFKKFFSMAISEEDIVKAASGLTQAYEGIEEYEKAIKIYEMVLSKIKNAELYNGLGYCWSKLSAFDKGIKYSKLAVDLEPDNAVFVNDLGFTYLENGELEKAKQLFLRSLEIDPEYDLAKRNLELCRRKISENKKKRGKTCFHRQLL